jgi:hypothetical protein
MFCLWVGNISPVLTDLKQFPNPTNTVCSRVQIFTLSLL